MAPPSKDTVETLLALDDAALFPRLAAWLSGAGEQDIAAYWNGYRIGGNPKSWIVDLVFIHWTRLDPQGAIAAAVGTPDAMCPWWAWSANDPGAALAAAIGGTPKMLERVAVGIGRFHPDWLLEHLDEIPEVARKVALIAFKEQNGAEDPLKSLEFMRENGLGHDAGTFKKLARKDPWKAMDWLGQNPSMLVDYESKKNPLDILVETMLSEHPDDLERIAAQLPSGLVKRKMEAAAFEQLLADDPEAAIARANATESNVIAAERFAKIGVSLAKTDPDQAFGILEKFWGDSPAGGSLPSGSYDLIRAEYPGGVSDLGSASIGVDELQRALVESDPERLMRTALASGRSISSITSDWAGHDVVSYARWADRQTDPAIRGPAVSTLIDRLEGMGNFSEAVDWARASGPGQDGKLSDIFRTWARTDPGYAASWLESSDLPKDRKERLRGVIESQKSNR